jgi:hypothetical protein
LSTFISANALSFASAYTSAIVKSIEKAIKFAKFATDQSTNKETLDSPKKCAFLSAKFIAK